MRTCRTCRTRRIHAFTVASRPEERGFTLIEVLIALVIVAVVLIAALRAEGSITQTNQALHLRLLASWSANNRLTEMHLAKELPTLGDRRYNCSEGEADLVCAESVSPTPNPIFRRVELTVFAADDEHTVLADVVTLVADETSRSL